MNFCPHCGAKLGQASHFCANCGAPLIPAQAASQKSTLASSPSLISNIIFFVLALFFLLVVVFAFGDEGGSDTWDYLFVSLALGIFAFLPSYNHIDTPKMNLLKTMESFLLSLAAFICSFFLPDSIIILGFAIFTCVFSLLVVLKIRKIPDSSRNTCEKIVCAISIILLAFSLLMILGSL